ncbi:hypothetical protein [Amycolatopsis sp. cmx-11-51]
MQLQEMLTTQPVIEQAKGMPTRTRSDHHGKAFAASLTVTRTE